MEKPRYRFGFHGHSLSDLLLLDGLLLRLALRLLFRHASVFPLLPPPHLVVVYSLYVRLLPLGQAGYAKLAVSSFMRV